MSATLSPATGIGVCGVGHSGQPYTTPAGQHTLSVALSDPSSKAVFSSWSSLQPGEASDAHAALAKRWKDAGHTFERDSAALSLSRLHVDGVFRWVGTKAAAA